jgi:CheY-like chemotaxis protein
MVVDDCQDTADSMADLFNLHGFSTRSACCAAEAIRLASAEPPDVVVLDLLMPGMNGWDLAYHLTNEVKPPILVAVSGCGTEADRRRSNLAGIDLHLVKPVKPAILIGLLKRFARALGTSTVEDECKA